MRVTAPPPERVPRALDFIRAERRAQAPEVADPVRTAAWHHQLLLRAEQALDDIARAESAEVAFVRHPRMESAREYLDDLEERASRSGFVTAQVRIVADCAFD